MVFLDMAMSLDGFVSGPNGEDWGLHDWYFAPSAPSRAVVDELFETIGAMVLGKRSFAVGDEQGSPEDSPYKMPHFVITHEPREPKGVVSFVTEGLESALEQARAATGSQDVCVAGGANIAQQALRAGLLDEVQLHLVPKLFGRGLRLFEGLEAAPTNLERLRVVEDEGVTHLRFRVLKEG